MLYIYIGECSIKAIGLGIEKYWEDNWNRFDLALVILSLVSNIFVSVVTILKTARSARAGKLIRLTRLNRLFRMFRAVRNINVVNFIMIGADTVSQVKLLIYKIFSCLPLSN